MRLSNVCYDVGSPSFNGPSEHRRVKRRGRQLITTYQLLNQEGSHWIVVLRVIRSRFKS